MPLTDDQIDKLVDRIGQMDKSVAVQVATLATQVTLWQQESQDSGKKLAVVWDWKNQVNGSIRTIKYIQGAILAVVAVVEVWRAFHGGP